MNRGPGALDFTEEPEGENTYGKANQWDNYSKLSDPCQDIIIFNSLRANNNSMLRERLSDLSKGLQSLMNFSGKH